MNYIDRVRYRVKEEGVSKTLKYLTYVSEDCVHKFFRDTFLDLRYSGRSLTGNEKTTYKQFGANDVYHTDYSAMPLIFNFVNITPEDVLVDVGCGKGRVLNYWLSQGYTNSIIGLELDPFIAQQATLQFAKWPNVTILQGDAVSNLPLDGTIFYFYNPFEEPKVREFEDKVSALPSTKPIKVIYYNPKSLNAFQNDHWNIAYINFEQTLGIQRWGRLNKYHDLAILTKIL